MDLHIGWEFELFGRKALFILKGFLCVIAILFRITNTQMSALNNSREKLQFELFQNKSVLHFTHRGCGFFMKHNEKHISGGFILLTNTTEDLLWWVVWDSYRGTTKGTGCHQRTQACSMQILCKIHICKCMFLSASQTVGYIHIPDNYWALEKH